MKTSTITAIATGIVAAGTAALMLMGVAVPVSEETDASRSSNGTASERSKATRDDADPDDGLIRELAPAGLAFSTRTGRCAMRIVATGPYRVPDAGIDQRIAAGPSSIIRTMSYEGNIWQSRRLRKFERGEGGYWTSGWLRTVEKRWGDPTAVLRPANGNCGASMIVVYASSPDELRQRKPTSEVLPGVQCPPLDCVDATIEHDRKVYRAKPRYLESLASCARRESHPSGKALYVFVVRMPGGLVIEYVSATDHDAETAAYFAGRAPRMCPAQEAAMNETRS